MEVATGRLDPGHPWRVRLGIRLQRLQRLSETSQDSQESQGETFETTYQASSNVQLGSSDSDNKKKQKPRKNSDNGEKNKAKASDKEDSKGEKSKESNKKIDKPTEAVKPSIKTVSKTATETQRVQKTAAFNPQSNLNQISNLVPPIPNNPNDLRSKLARSNRIVPEITIVNETDIEIEDRATEEVRKKKVVRKLPPIPRKGSTSKVTRRRDSSDSD